MRPTNETTRRARLWSLAPFLTSLLCNALVSAEEFSPRLPTDRPAADASASPKVLGQLAIAPTPRHFPNFDATDVARMFEQTSEVGQGAVFIYQWSDPEFAVAPARMTVEAKQRRLTVILGLSPTTLDQSRKELDVPADLRDERRSFGNPKLRLSYLKAAETLAQLRPPYLCLATEINLLALQRLDEFLQFASLYKEAYRAVKKISPATKVFVSFQYEFIRIVDNKEPGKLGEHAKAIDIFRPELDLVAITSYPAGFYSSPAELPANYYAHLQHYLRRGDDVMVMEIGWPSGGKSTQETQRQFVERLPALLAPLAPRVTAWSLLHDVKLGAFGEDLATTGLYTANDEAKPALAAWRLLAGKRARSAQ